MTPHLLPYIPRLTVTWHKDAPDATARVIDGSLLFADISGFTAMSERLARKGREGAEEVTDILDRNFSHLLEGAYQEGGSLLKFGGDALLLLFVDKDHPLRACRGAVEMRRRLRAAGKLKTSAGLVTLRMSSGVHSGPLQFFLAGESHRELIVTGPGATATVAMESAASAGQIVVSDGTAGALPPGCTMPAPTAGHFLTRTPPGPIAARPADLPVHANFDVGVYVPVGLRHHLSEASQDSEHRQVTIAFLHFEGVDEIIRRDGPDEAATVLDGLVRSVQSAAEEYEVCFLATDIDRDGGKIILTSGAPVSSGDDEERMLRTVRTVSDGAHGSMVCIGVNRGYVFAGDVGPPYRRTYTVMGDAVNLAARLMSRARPGEILVSPGVLQQSASRFEVEEVEPFNVKGKAKPVQAMRLGRLLARPASARRDRRAPLIGRDHELEPLLRAVEHARSGKPGVAVVTGEAGMGKSRLLEEMISRAGDVRCLRTSGQQYEASTAYFPFRRLLRSLLELDDHDSDETGRRLTSLIERRLPALKPWLPLLAIPFDATVASTPEVEALPPTFRRGRLHDAITQLLADQLDEPAVLLFDDVHWFDEASLDLLQHLAQYPPERPWLVCILTRGDVPDALAERPDTLIIRLRQLSPQSALTLATALTADLALPDHELSAIADRGAGNPLFLEEIAAAWQRGGHEGAPETIESMLVARIDSLNPPDRALLRYASVIGSTFTLDELREAATIGLAGPVAISHGLQQFLASDGPALFRFKHELVREVAYATLPFRKRRDLHRAAGLRMEERAGRDAEAHAEILSLHFDRAQDFPRSWRYSRAAGDRAKAKFANVEAAVFYRRSVAAARHTGGIDENELARVLESLGDVCELSAEYAEAIHAYRSARRYVGDDLARETGLLHKTGVIRERLGQYPQALRFYSRALRRATSDNLSLARARLGLAYAGVRFRQGKYGDCISWCNQTLPVVERADDRRLLAHAYYLLDHAYTLSGSKEGERYRALALPIYEELGDLVGQANVLNNLGVTAYFHGKWDEALELYSRSRRAREEAGDVVGAATAANNIAEILSDQGRIEEAEELFQSALRTWRAARYTVGIALATSNLGRAAARAGRFDEGDRLLNQAFEAFKAIGATSFALETEARIAEMLVERGEARRAASRIDTLLGQIEGMPSNGVLRAMLLRLKARVCGAEGHTDECRRMIVESEHEAREASAEYELALTLLASAELRLDPSGTSAAEARGILERLGVVQRSPTDRLEHAVGDAG